MNTLSHFKWITLILLSSSFLNCQQDDSSGNLDQNMIMKGGKILPDNSLNPYDSYGLLHNEVLAIYLSENHNHQSLQEVADEVELLLSSFYPVDSNTQTQVFNISELENILKAPYSSLEVIVNNSGLAALAKVDLTLFLGSLISMEDEDFSDVKTLIAIYEGNVLLNPLYSENDKRIMLTVSSIIRYSFYYRIGRDEGDWDTSVSHRAAAVKGALNSSLDAVALALIVSIADIESNP